MNKEKRLRTAVKRFLSKKRLANGKFPPNLSGALLRIYYRIMGRPA